ncbi:MAG: motility associated factor glycosyltransferase family protein [Treponema sp.]|nr:motility associated factor glycosyltransferase family protein [Treponema sp.]
MNYTNIIESKTGLQIPCHNTVSFHSKYNPEKEAETFAAQFSQTSRFFVILGICGAYHLLALKKKFPAAKIIAVEESREDIDFLSHIPQVESLEKNKDFVLTDCAGLQAALLRTYKPQLHGNLIISSIRQWENTFNESAKKARDIIAATIKLISADYSVQSHFGKIWQKNIFGNLALSSRIKQNVAEMLHEVPTEKTAAIIAAGPTLDETSSVLKDKRTEFFVIATDTAYTSLCARSIQPDAVVSVDGQMISHAHFFNDTSKNTLFVFDLCANHSAAKKVLKSGARLIFSQSKHPLAQYASQYTGKNSFIPIETGSGTVTIAAASFAILCGFTKLRFFGADFSYLNGKSYTKNTYLDTVYREHETRIHTTETSFDRLLFRTELIRLAQNHYTTEVLESYRSSLADFLSAHSFAQKSADTFCAQNAPAGDTKTKETTLLAPFDFKDFSSYYATQLKNFFSKNSQQDDDDPLVLTLLPLCAWIENHKKSSKFNYTDSSLLIAYQQSLRYTEII